MRYLWITGMLFLLQSTFVFAQEIRNLFVAPSISTDSFDVQVEIYDGNVIIAHGESSSFIGNKIMIKECVELTDAPVATTLVHKYTFAMPTTPIAISLAAELYVSIYDTCDFGEPVES